MDVIIWAQILKPRQKRAGNQEVTMKQLDELLAEIKCRPGLINGQTVIEVICDNGPHQGTQRGVCEMWDSNRLCLRKEKWWIINIALEDIAHIRVV